MGSWEPRWNCSSEGCRHDTSEFMDSGGLSAETTQTHHTMPHFACASQCGAFPKDGRIFREKPLVSETLRDE